MAHHNARSWGTTLGLAAAIGLSGMASHAAGLGTSEAWAGQDKPDVVLVVWDAMRPDHLTPYGHSRDTTPNLSKLGKKGAVFEVATSTAPWTMPSVAGIFTGLFAHNHGVDFKETNFTLNVPEQATTWAEMMKAEGYQTGLWTSQGIYAKQESFLQGFDHVRTRKDTRETNFHDEALAYLDKAGDTPVFLVLYYLDPHAPYTPPAEHDIFTKDGMPPANIRGCPKTVPEGTPEHFHCHAEVNSGSVKLSDPEWATMEALYDGELHYNDAMLGSFYEGLVSRGIADTTAIFFTSDHGEAFNEHEEERTWHRKPFETVLRVPLIAYYPPAIKPSRVKASVRSIDIYPTVADMLNASPPHALNGESLLPLADKAAKGRITAADNRVVVGASHFAGAPAFYRDGKHKLIYSRLGPSYVRVYDLVADPDEQNDLSSNAALVAELKAKRDAVLKATKVDLGSGAEASQEELERLRALGYVD